MTIYGLNAERVAPVFELIVLVVDVVEGLGRIHSSDPGARLAESEGDGRTGGGLSRGVYRRTCLETLNEDIVVLNISNTLNKRGGEVGPVEDLVAHLESALGLSGVVHDLLAETEEICPLSERDTFATVDGRAFRKSTTAIRTTTAKRPSAI